MENVKVYEPMCILCQSTQIILLDTIKKDDIIKLYKTSLNIDISYLIYEDINFLECQECKIRFFDPPITGDEKLYNALQKFDWYYLHEKEEYSYASKEIKKDDKVLEIGAGKGFFAKYLPTKKYIGLELSKRAKEMASKIGVKVEVIDIKDYAPIHKEEFEVVACFQVLEHVKDPAQFIESMLLCLKKGGKLIISVPSEDSFLKYATNSALNMPPHHVTRWSIHTLEYVAIKYNLKIKSIYHENLQDIHKTWYLATLITNSLIKPKLINMSIYWRIVNKFSFILAKFLSRGLKKEMLPKGHTVIAIYEKT